MRIDMHWLAFVALLAAACGDETTTTPPEEESLDAEACEHMTEGPFNDVAAAADAAGAPSVAAEHTGHRIALTSEGYVAFGSDEAGELVVFLSEAVPFSIEDGAGDEVALESSCSAASGCSEECNLVLGRHLVDLEVGSYAFHFGPSSETTLLLVHERTAHTEHE